MKKLYIIRHAKTINSHGNMKDFDRYLKPQGHDDAKTMAKLILENYPAPELIISSPAKRAQQTSNIFSEILNYDSQKIINDENIYYGGINELSNIFTNIDNSISIAMLIGHNPTVHEMINHFIDGHVYIFPPCSITGIEFDIENWKNIKPHQGKLFLYEKP